MGFTLTGADERKLAGVNSRLVAVVRGVAFVSPVRFKVLEGVRTKSRQRLLVKQGKSKTLDSRHLIGRAVDIVPLIDGKVSWEWEHFTPIVECAKAVSAHLGVPLTFGYDWGWDAPHWEMKEP